MTNPDTPIPWGRYSPDQIERLLAALLLRMHAGARRMDGAGGDDGVDVLVPVDGGIHVYEIKSYSERLKTPQKRAIAKSAKTAAENNADMVAWTLVLPLDHTPTERRWMDRDLAALAGVPVDWMGRTQLEVELGLRPDVMRGFAPGNVQDLAFQMLSEYGHEQAVPPRTVADVVQRAQRLAEQSDAVDPFWAFGVSVAGEAVTVTASPKSDSAPPVRGQVAFQAEPGSAEAAAIEDFMTYGRPLRLEAGNLTDVELALPPGLAEVIGEEVYAQGLDITTPEVQQAARLDAVNTSGRVLGSLSVTFTQVTQGPRGGVFQGGLDRSGFLWVAVKVGADGTEGEFEIESRYTNDLLPADVVPALRFLEALGRAAQVHISFDGQTYPARIPGSKAGFVGMENMVRMAEALERIGRAAGVVLHLPERWSAEDALNVAFWDELLALGRAPYPTPVGPQVIALESVQRLLSQGPLPRASMTAKGQSRAPRLLGVELPLPGTLSFETTGLLVANPAELARQVQATPPPQALEVMFAADGQTTTVFRLDPDPGGPPNP